MVVRSRFRSAGAPFEHHEPAEATQSLDRERCDAIARRCERLCVSTVCMAMTLFVKTRASSSDAAPTSNAKRSHALSTSFAARRRSAGAGHSVPGALRSASVTPSRFPSPARLLSASVNAPQASGSSLSAGARTIAIGAPSATRRIETGFAIGAERIVRRKRGDRQPEIGSDFLSCARYSVSRRGKMSRVEDDAVDFEFVRAEVEPIELRQRARFGSRARTSHSSMRSSLRPGLRSRAKRSRVIFRYARANHVM